MRGAQYRDPVAREGLRIIPADAGSTRAEKPFIKGKGDHPRGCGEHVGQGFADNAVAGSSPRMRGALPMGRLSAARNGIIPADAGSTCSGSVDGSSSWDHPRGCGEHYHCIMPSVIGSGSSPRMRGAPLPATTATHKPGIIPADAGSTTRSNGRILGKKDHPRGCGEHR